MSRTGNCAGKEKFVVDESYTFHLMEIHVKNTCCKIDFQNFLLHRMLLITKIKLLRGTCWEIAKSF